MRLRIREIEREDFLRALGDVVESEPLVGVDHDLERFLDRGRAVVVLDREARAVDRGDVGLAIEVVLRDVDLVVGEPVAQVDHPLPRVRREDAVRPLLDQLVEGIEGASHVLRRALVEVRAEPALEEVRCAFEIDQSAHVHGVVHARVRRVLADELVGRVDRRLLLARAVVRVDDVEPGLPRFLAEREARLECLVVANGTAVVAPHEESVGLLEHAPGLKVLCGALLVSASRDCEQAARDEQGARPETGWLQRTGPRQLERRSIPAKDHSRAA